MFLAAWKLEMHGARLMDARRYDEALKCYRQLTEKVKPTAYHWEMLARCYEWVGETEQAESAGRRALEADEGRFGALRLLARLSIAQGHYAQARDYVQKALVAERRPPAGQPRFLLAVGRLLDRTSRRRQTAGDTDAFTRDPEQDDEQWCGWARDFLNGYERAFGEQSHARPH